MKTDQIFALIILLLMIATATALGQAPTPPTPPEVPLDGGISALVAGGAALGARYYWKKSKQR